MRPNAPSSNARAQGWLNSMVHPKILTSCGFVPQRITKHPPRLTETWWAVPSESLRAHRSDMVGSNVQILETWWKAGGDRHHLLISHATLLEVEGCERRWEVLCKRLDPIRPDSSEAKIQLL
mmetsp:Transcript_3795/g.9566  ORF Transcript_3795/g.9566 Transcript_3795/m.9566 type:complete len:122 (-) Transcript_3795:5-370(-)